MHVKNLVLTFLLLISCNEVKKKDSFHMIKERWISANHLKIINEKEFEVSFLDINAQPLIDCFRYIARTKKSPGRIVISPKQAGVCSFEKKIATKENIFNFEYEFREGKLLLKIDTQTFSYTFYNYKRRKHELYKSPQSLSALPGVSLVSQIKGERIPQIKRGSYCEKVEDDCSESIKAGCSLCEKGWYYIYDTKCPTKLSKVCGEDNCGLKNEYACVRGIKTSGVEHRLYCITDSPFGFCEKNLRVFCENERLVCK